MCEHILRRFSNLCGVFHPPLAASFSRIGTCTPFVEDTPGLSTHTSADTALLDADGYAAFSADLELEAGLYTIIAHLRFYTLDDDVPSPVGGCEGKDCLKVRTRVTGRLGERGGGGETKVSAPSQLLHAKPCICAGIEGVCLPLAARCTTLPSAPAAG